MGVSVEFVPEDVRSTTMGIHQAVYGIGMFAGPWIGGLLADFTGIRIMLGITAFACLGLGLFGTYKLINIHKRLTSKQA
jgi:MFS family permease